MTYFRAGRTIIGPRCLSAVFGMGTGVSTWAWSPASLLLASGGLRPAVLQRVRLIFVQRGDANSTFRLLYPLLVIHKLAMSGSLRMTGEGMVRSSGRLLVPVH
jgi:hypothetical protein